MMNDASRLVGRAIGVGVLAALLSSVPAGATFGQPTKGAAARTVTPARGSADRKGVLDALRRELRISSQFEVEYIRVSGRWAWVRCGEVVVAEGELQETDLSVVALLERATVKGRPGWRVAEMWTLPEENERPWRAFAARVRARQRADRLPADLFDGPVGDVP